MSESYVINEKRELILDRVKEFIYQNGGVVKKSQLNELVFCKVLQLITC